jgi:hypothetical protein
MVPMHVHRAPAQLQSEPQFALLLFAKVHLGIKSH